VIEALQFSGVNVMAKYPSKSSMVGMIALALLSSAAMAAKPVGGGGGGSKGGGGGDTGTNPATIVINAAGNALECTVSGSGLPDRYVAYANCRGDSPSTVVATWGCEMPTGAWSTYDVTSSAMTPAPERVLTDRRGRATATLLWSLVSDAPSELQTQCRNSGGAWAVCSVSIAGGESWWTDGATTVYGSKTPLMLQTIARNGCTGT
jgi:hypothetical protein